MKLGFTTMNTPEDLAPDELGPLLEERGFESLWIGEHSHIPASRATPYPAGGELPPQYLRMMDPFLSLLLAAKATHALVVGTSVALPLEHDVFQLAKTVATLDRLSAGRFQFGVGVGWNVEELADHRPVPWPERYRALAECMAALRTLWRDEESEFHGRYYDFDPVWCQPKPFQQPHPPILCGVAGPVGISHALDWSDGWMPMDVALGDVAEKIERFREAAEAAGRPAPPITLVAFGDPSPQALEGYRSLGVERVILGAARDRWDDPSSTVPFLDRYTPLVSALR